MRRRNLGLALVSSAVAVVVVVLIYGIDTQRSAVTAVEPRRSEANGAIHSSSINTELNESTAVMQRRSSDVSQKRIHADQDQPYTVILSRDGSIVDEDTALEGVRGLATNLVRRRYALLLQDLDLTPREREALFALLVEDDIASTSTPYQRGKIIDKEEQSRRISAIIGDRKLQQFRELESHLGAYAEVHNIGSLLQANDIPLTEAQRDRLLKLVIETQVNYPLTSPPADIDPGSIEFLERQLSQRAEYERHLMEVVPSALSAEQVVYLDQQYQYLSYMRGNSVERQRQERADGTRDNALSFPLWAE